MLSLSKYRSYLNLSPENDDELVDLKEEVEALWEEMTQRPWKAETGRVEVHRVDGPRITTIFPHLRPVTSVTKVEIKSEDGAEADWEELEAADEGWELQNNQIIRYGTWWKPLVRITYDGGFATDACPGDVKRALKIQAKFARERQDTEVKISAQNFKGGQGQFVDPDVHPYFSRLAESKRRLV